MAVSMYLGRGLAQAWFPLPTCFDSAAGADAVALIDAAVQGSVGEVAGFNEHFVFGKAKRIADQPHAEPLDFAVGA